MPGQLIHIAPTPDVSAPRSGRQPRVAAPGFRRAADRIRPTRSPGSAQKRGPALSRRVTNLRKPAPQTAGRRPPEERLPHASHSRSKAYFRCRVRADCPSGGSERRDRNHLEQGVAPKVVPLRELTGVLGPNSLPSAVDGSRRWLRASLSVEGGLGYQVCRARQVDEHVEAGLAARERQVSCAAHVFMGGRGDRFQVSAIHRV